jgi:hypothetical protein
MPRNQKKIGGSRVDVGTTKLVDQPRYEVQPEDEVVVVNPSVILASRASVASVGSVASGASTGSVASVASFASRSSAASLASAGSLTSAASYGSVASIASVAFLSSRASQASAGSSATSASIAALPSIPAVSSIAGPAVLTLSAQAAAENIAVVKKGSSGTVAVSASDSVNIAGHARRDISTEHKVEFLIPDGTDWSVLE